MIEPLSTAVAVSPWPHRLAMLLCCATFPLVWIGGLVTTYEAGMAVPDWPNTYGYNLFLYPIETWVAGPWDIFIEHGHRLLASAVGMLAIALCVSVWMTRQPRWLLWLSLIALAAVIFQGVLGGMRVLMDERTLAKIHGCFGPAFFALTAVLAMLTSRRWRRMQQQATNEVIARVNQAPGLASSLLVLAMATPILAYLQLVLGAQLRHIEPTASHAVFRTFVVFHVVVGIALSVHIVVTALCFVRKTPKVGPLVAPAAILAGLVLCQLALGAATWVVNYGWPGMFATPAAMAELTVQARGWWQAQITTAHVAVGSLILAVAAVMALNAACLLRIQPIRLPRAAEWKGALA